MIYSTAICPAAVSFVFRAFLPEGAITTRQVADFKHFGSTGVGCTINRNVVAKVSIAADNSIFFNGLRIKLPTIITALEKLTHGKFRTSLTSELPIGCGFGISGAATLATLWAANQLLNKKQNFRTLSEIAHFAEITNRTGLGTVATQITGGFLVKSKPGIPVTFKRLSFTGSKIYAVILGKVSTAKILANNTKMILINNSAESTLEKINKIKSPALSEIIKLSYDFCKKSRIYNYSEANSIISKIYEQNGSATMSMVGHVILSTIKPSLPNKNILELTIVNNKVKLLETNEN